MQENEGKINSTQDRRGQEDPDPVGTVSLTGSLGMRTSETRSWLVWRVDACGRWLWGDDAGRAETILLRLSGWEMRVCWPGLVTTDSP